MDTDLIFVVGVIICVMAIPATLSAFMDGRAPRAPAMIILIGAVMIGYVVNERPMTYTLANTPDAFMRVIASFTH